ncbi:MAG: response regulator [Betaproteobacteria bacterium]
MRDPMENYKQLRYTFLVLCLLLVVGYISYSYSQHVGIQARQNEAARRLEIFSGALFTPMEKYDYLPEITSNHALVIAALRQANEPARIQKLNAYLEYLNTKTKSEAIYVLDASGLTIASSNWRGPVSFVGQNYFFRPYFKDAIESGQGRFYGLGTVSLLPGYYLSHQVISKKQLLGVVVVKVDLGELDAGWDVDQDIMVVTDENGIVFLSSRKDWKYSSLGKLDEKTLEHLERTQQYGSDLKAPIRLQNENRLDDGNRIVRIRESTDGPVSRGRRYLVRTSLLQGSKWEVSIFTPLAETDTRSRQAAFAALATVIFLILLFMYFQQARKRRSEKEEAQQALQQAHQELEAQHGELEALNLHLQSQSEKLKRTVSELELAKVEADSANLAKSEFLASMSHEIRTPMSAILGLTHLTLKTELTAKQRNYLANVDGAATALLGVLNNVLDFSKIEAGKLPIEHIAFNLSEVFDNISAILALSAEGKGVELIFEISPTIPRELIGDPLRLGQVLLNLVNNAIKFTEQGEVLVSVESTSLQNGSIELKFKIKDTGIGISAPQMRSLFQSFSQADQSTTRRYGGTGLGLAISKKLTEAMGGNIDVESLPGQGSTFTFTVALECQSESANAYRESIADWSGLRVLVVDDNATVREALTRILQAWSLRVIAVDSGKAAIALLSDVLNPSENDFDLILIDYKMPKMDGIDTVRRIRKELSQLRIPKIIMMTSYGNDDAAMLGGDIGVDALIAKPIETSLLLAVLTNALGNELTEKIPTRSSATLSNTPNVTGLRVLVAEDNEINQQMICEILESAGVICEIVANGRDAVRSALQPSANYDLILLDLEMPVMDGLEAARKIRQQSMHRFPIIALTAYALEQDRQRCLEAGIDHHLTKPVHPERLIAEISRWASPGFVCAATSSAGRFPFEAAVSNALIADIDALLATNNMNAEDIILQLHDVLAGLGFDECLERLDEAIDNLNYSLARHILNELANALVLYGDSRSVST